MNKVLSFLLLVIFFTNSYSQKTNKYPTAPKDSTFNIYFETKIDDPYQWMENPNDPRLTDWLTAQKKITDKQDRQQIHKESLLRQIVSIYKNSDSELKDDYVEKKNKSKILFEFKYESADYDKTQDLLYRPKGQGNTYKYLVKIKNFSKNKNDKVVITNQTLSPKYNLTAIEMSHNGSDWREVYFFDLFTGKQLTDTLLYLRIDSKIIWDDEGVYYDRYNKPIEGRELLDKAKGQALYYHKIGTKQSDDILIYQNPDQEGTNYFSYFKQDSTKLIFYHFLKSRGVVYKAISYATLNPSKTFFLKNFLLYPNTDSINFFVEKIIENTAYLKTTWGAPNGKVIKADINQLNKMEEFIPEFDCPLREVNRLGKDKIACTYRNNGQFKVLIYNFNGVLLKSIDFPVGKSLHNFYENDSTAEYTDFCLSSFYHPNIWYQLSLSDLSFKPRETIWVPYDAKKLETRYVNYKSKDGTEIPMYITCRKDIKLDGTNPTLLYGYGGYGITIEPSFDETTTLWLLHGGILAIPNIRGGGAEASDWAKEGRRLKKQNAIDDFIAAAEYLIKEQYTNPEKLAIKGGSHGGMLVGASITQRPELFKAAIAEAGALDMLRSENFTAGSVNTNIEEFGTTTNQEDFVNIKSYSPYHNIKEGTIYPNLLLITGDKDDRVPPFHSYKFLARLQEKANPQSLYHLYTVPGSGHGGALTDEDFTKKVIFENYFLFDQLGLKFW